MKTMTFWSCARRDMEILLVALMFREEMATQPLERHNQTELLTTAQAAELLNVHPNTVRNWADAAFLPSYRIGPRRDRRFRRGDVEALLQESNGHTETP